MKLYRKRKVMSNENSIHFRRVQPDNFEEIHMLSVDDEQVRYVGTTQSLVEKSCETSHYHFILRDGLVVGFFNIDTVYAQRYDFAMPEELGLRAFFIDKRFQGKGLGKASVKALKAYLTMEYSDRPSVVLTVNCKNPAAYKSYRHGGFWDTGELYYGGKAGPQHIMRMRISGSGNVMK